MIYFFSLGRTITLCFAELEALLKTSHIDYQIKYQTGSHVIIETEKEIDCEKLLKQSGGIIKIGTLLSAVTSQSEIYDFCSDNHRVVTTIKNKYKNFGVSLIGFKDNIQKICESFKTDLKLHYTLPKDGFELSSSQVSNGNTLEIVIVKTAQEFQIFQTIAVQDINYWSKKDVGRPNIDDKLGMLPLKVARMMINLGLGGIDSVGDIGGLKIIDPFCGMGSILQEAIDLGFKHIVGSDINANVLTKAERNLKWFINVFSCQHVNMIMINSDAAKISEQLTDKVDLIVTEPFLGNAQKLKILSNTSKIPKNVKIEIKNIIKGLEKMYIGCLKDWRKILKNESAICIVVPEIEFGKKVYTIPFVEICAKTGYNVLNSYDYSREKAVVKRKIYILNIK